MNCIALSQAARLCHVMQIFMFIQILVSVFQLKYLPPKSYFVASALIIKKIIIKMCDKKVRREVTSQFEIHVVICEYCFTIVRNRILFKIICKKRNFRRFNTIWLIYLFICHKWIHDFGNMIEKSVLQFKFSLRATSFVL